MDGCKDWVALAVAYNAGISIIMEPVQKQNKLKKSRPPGFPIPALNDPGYHSEPLNILRCEQQLDCGLVIQVGDAGIALDAIMFTHNRSFV